MPACDKQARDAHLQRAVSTAIDSSLIAISLRLELNAVRVKRNDYRITGEFDHVPAKCVHDVNDLHTTYSSGQLHARVRL